MLTTVIDQSVTIKDLIVKLQNLLLGVQLVEFFKANPEKTLEILEQTENYRSRRLVLLGLKDALQSEVLPDSKDLHRLQDWLVVGDCVLGWRSGLTGEPRIITRSTPEGYYWRYISSDIEKSPNKFWPYLNGIGFEKVELVSEELEDQLVEIHDIQANEITILQNQLAYFSSREFMNV